jgi:Cytochrome C biogenesis protein transmembrane region
VIELGAAGLAAAFAAGFVSFLSPCVLPLVPGYLSLVSGVGFDDVPEQQRRVVGTSLAFVAGFGAVFVLFVVVLPEGCIPRATGKANAASKSAPRSAHRPTATSKPPTAISPETGTSSSGAGTLLARAYATPSRHLSR